MIEKITMIFIIVVVTVISAWLIPHFMDRYIRRLTERSQTGLDDMLLNVLKGPVAFAIGLLGLWFVLQQSDFIINPDSSSLSTMFFILIMALSYITTIQLLVGFIKWYEDEIARKTETTLDEQILPFFRRVSVIILTIIVLVAFLGHFDINVSALVTTLGIGSLAIALAAKEILADTISGFIIIIDRPFRIGDRIEIATLKTWGDVKDIGLRSTSILTRDNRMVFVPNSLIGKNIVVNHSIPDTIYRVQTHVSVSYGVDVDRVRQVLVEAVQSEAWVMKGKPVEALFLEFMDSGLSFRVRCWIEHYMETRRVIDKLNTTIYKALKQADIEIPFPQRVLHIQNNDSQPFFLDERA